MYQHRRQSVELSGKRNLENRRTRHRFFRSMYAGWCGRMAALRKKRQAQGKPFDKPNFVISTGFQVVWEKFAQLWQIEMREVPLTLDKTTLDPEEALKMCDENTICIVPIQGVTWTGLNDDVEALTSARRIQRQDRLRHSYPRRCCKRRLYPPFLYLKEWDSV